VSPTEKIKKVAVVIPAYKVKKHIAEVVGSIGPEISSIIVVDDACPEESGDYILSASKDKRSKMSTTLVDGFASCAFGPLELFLIG
jgi:glycosyltransferase involved in cell wall biosynthesis